MGKATAKFPQGWMNKAGRKFLRARGRRLPSDGLAVEVGSWKGRSTLAIVRSMTETARLYAVDTWAGVPDDPDQHGRLYADSVDPFVEFQENLKRHIRLGRVVPLHMDSLAGAAEIARRHGAQSLDFVFIDADHRYDAVRADILAYRPLLKDGGLLMGHDFGGNYPGVMKAVGELVPGFRVYRDSTIWWAKVAA